jgi:hypothetical protein
MKSNWYWWPGYDPIRQNPTILCKEDTDIKLLWNPIVPKGTTTGYNVYTVNNKGIVSSKPLNENPIKAASFLLKTPDMKLNYIVKAVNLDGSEVAATQVTSTAVLCDYLLMAYGENIYSESLNLRNKNIMVEPYSMLSCLEHVYNNIYWEKHPEQKGKEQEIFKIEEAAKGDAITFSYRKSRLVIKDGSEYYILNGKKKSFGFVMKKIKDKDGLRYYEIPLSVLSEALGFKVEKKLDTNIINITFASK